MPKLPHFSPVPDNVRIRGFSTRVRALANLVEIRDVVSALVFHQLDPQGREITDIGNKQRKNPLITVRLDRQANTSSGATNLQIQVNDAALHRIRLHRNEGTTIAQVLVPSAIYQAALQWHDPSVRTHLENIVRSSLLLSHASLGGQYTIVDDR